MRSTRRHWQSTARHRHIPNDNHTYAHRYFAKDKIFLAYFWLHLRQKNFKDRTRRLRFFEAALDVLRNTTFTPTTKQNPEDAKESLHRFYGITRDDELFYIQIKENNKTGRKDLISIFPPN